MLGSLLDPFGGGRKFYMRDFKNAYRFRPHVNPVRQQFQGYVNFVFNREIFPLLFADGDANRTEFRTTIGSLVRTAELPSATFRTDTLNAYNRKKIVNTGVDYDPVSMTVYDTVGNEWLGVLMKYFAYHYMDPRNKQQDAGDRDMQGGRSGASTVHGSSQNEFLNSAFGREGQSTFDSNAHGYNPNISAHFFERIDYVLYHGNKGVQYSIFNPVLTSFKPAAIDYTTSEFRDFQMSFEYERFTVYNAVNFGLSAEDLDRFENVANLEGPAFQATDNITSLEERDLRVLGVSATQPDERERTFQAPVEAQSGTQEPLTSATGLNSEGGVPFENLQSQGPGVQGTPATYGPSADVSTQSGGTDNPFLDILGDVGSNAISAAIHGTSVRDAALSSAVGATTDLIGQAAAGFLNGDDSAGFSGDVSVNDSNPDDIPPVPPGFSAWTLPGRPELEFNRPGLPPLGDDDG